MSKGIELEPGEQVIYRTATPLGMRIMVHYFVGISTVLFFGLGLFFLFGWGFPFYSDAVITTQRVMLRKSGLFRSSAGYRSIPLDQIYLSEAWMATITAGDRGVDAAIARSTQRVELDLLDGKTVVITVPRANVFVARLEDAKNA